MTVSIKIDHKTPLSILRALALSFARDIDTREGNVSATRIELERVMALIPNAPKGRFA